MAGGSVREALGEFMPVCNKALGLGTPRVPGQGRPADALGPAGADDVWSFERPVTTTDVDLSKDGLLRQGAQQLRSSI